LGKRKKKKNNQGSLGAGGKKKEEKDGTDGQDRPDDPYSGKRGRGAPKPAHRGGGRVGKSPAHSVLGPSKKGERLARFRLLFFFPLSFLPSDKEKGKKEGEKE